MIKTLQKAGIEGTYLNIIKAVYDKATANIILTGEKLKAFPLKSRTRQGCTVSSLLFNIVLEVLATAIRAGKKKKKRNPDWKRRNKTLTLCRWHAPLCRKPSTRRLLIDEYSKVAGNTINTQKPLTLLYTNSEKTKREIKETIPFMIAKKRIKCLGIYLPKETKDLYIESYKTLMKEIKEDTNRWRNIPCSCIGRINIVKMSILPKAIYSMQSLSSYKRFFFFFPQRTRTNNVTICMEIWKKPWIAKAILRKMNGIGGINLPDFRLYYIATVIKTVWYWHKDKYRSMEQNRKPRDKSMHLWTAYLWQRRQEYTMEKRQSL